MELFERPPERFHWDSLGFHQQTQKLEPPCTPSIINSTTVNYCRFVHSRDINRRDIGLF